MLSLNIVWIKARTQTNRSWKKCWEAPRTGKGAHPEPNPWVTERLTHVFKKQKKPSMIIDLLLDHTANNGLLLAPNNGLLLTLIYRLRKTAKSENAYAPCWRRRVRSQVQRRGNRVDTGNPEHTLNIARDSTRVLTELWWIEGIKDDPTISDLPQKVVRIFLL